MIFLIIISVSNIAHADIYKWQDANGQTQYGQTPPNNVNATQIKPDVASSSSAPAGIEQAKKLEQSLQEQDKKAQEEKNKAAEDAKEAQIKAINCERAQAHLRDIESKVRMRMQDSSGNVTQLTTEQIEEDRKRTKEAVETYCSPGK